MSKNLDEKTNLPAEAISEEEIRDQLLRILNSQEFKKSPRIRKLLQYLTDQSLAENQVALEGRAIAINVFDRRPEQNNPEDSIVRVQVRRLRRMLSLYYLTEGRFDAIHVEIPKGNYILTFSRNAVRFLPSSERVDDGVKPSITVIPFEMLDNENMENEESEIQVLASGLEYELMNALSCHDEIRVVAYKSCNEQSKNTTAPKIGTDYCIRGTIQAFDDIVHIIAMLSRVEDKTVMSSQPFSKKLTTGPDILAAQSQIAEMIAEDTIKTIRDSRSLQTTAL